MNKIKKGYISKYEKSELCSTKYDQQFKEKGFTWFPWIGSKYGEKDSKHRILILGASLHAAWNADWDHTQKQETKENMVNSPDFQREVVEGHGILQKNQKTFPIWNKFLLGRENLSGSDTNNLWTRLAFTNARQEVMMSTNTDDKADEQDWKVFYELIKIIKPTLCIAMGNTVAHSWHDNENVPVTFDWHEKVNDAFCLGAREVGDSKLHMIAIRHPSRNFSWEPWDSYIVDDKFPIAAEALKELRAKVKEQ